MIQLTILFGHPQDPAAFENHYREIKIPLTRKIPGLMGYTVTRPVSLAPQEPSPYYLIATLFFETMETFQIASQSPEGQAAAGNLQTFATGGATVVVGEVEVHRSVSLR